MAQKKNLFGLTLLQLQQLCLGEGLPKYAARQICDWLYRKEVSTIDEMTNLSLKARARLKDIAVIEKTSPIEAQESKDGTKKYLFPVANGQYVEAVFIPDDSDEGASRATLCVSCQVGCRMGCQFCYTGKQGYHGNLSAAQILSQAFCLPEFHRLTNIVYMGMGEPMDNYDNVLQSLSILTTDWGLGWSPHRITVSSVGITPGILRFLQDTQCHLAISLHNAFPSQRAAIMPAQKAYPVADLVSLLRKQDWSGQRRLSFEYTMLQGENDDISHAAEVAKLLAGLRCRVNLIRCHATPDGRFKSPSMTVISSFRNYLVRHGLICTLRASRGEDIMAACGLLAGRSKDQA
ncbi:MAG: 23S rRNA (adenine(2503)-C(2))-methyltransferase RlmN [Bacteroidales bacterium]|nr:23S rRNA (adenine(2503)-C(2))-methyltransferase RlmN [Bacteroidales bacterium]